MATRPCCGSRAPRRALALVTDGKARFCALDPEDGHPASPWSRRRATWRAWAPTPRALVNCLNFGNPEHPEVMWQFSGSTDGMSEACAALCIPVVGGNVSFYNESRGHDIDPTPVVGLVGVIDELDAVPPPSALLTEGDAIVVLGTTRAELGGSEWATLHGLRERHPLRPSISTTRRRCTVSSVVSCP